jgi:hypothetical protein
MLKLNTSCRSYAPVHFLAFPGGSELIFIVYTCFAVCSLKYDFFTDTRICLSTKRDIVATYLLYFIKISEINEKIKFER